MDEAGRSLLLRCVRMPRRVSQTIAPGAFGRKPPAVAAAARLRREPRFPNPRKRAESVAQMTEGAILGLARSRRIESAGNDHHVAQAANLRRCLEGFVDVIEGEAVYVDAAQVEGS